MTKAAVDTDLLAALTGGGRRPCKWGVTLDMLPPPARAAVEQAAAAGVSAGRIVKVLRERGLPVAYEATIRKHLAGACGCPKA